MEHVHDKYFCSCNVDSDIHSYDCGACTRNYTHSPPTPSAIQDDTNVWDEGPDSEKNFRYNVSKPGTVAGATFNKLVERVTSEKDHGRKICVSLFICLVILHIVLVYGYS